jgi:hypothetical protein
MLDDEIWWWMMEAKRRKKHQETNCRQCLNVFVVLRQSMQARNEEGMKMYGSIDGTNGWQFTVPLNE